jgi:hypothetical protein
MALRAAVDKAEITLGLWCGSCETNSTEDAARVGSRMPVSAPVHRLRSGAGLCSVRFYLCKRGRKPCSSPASLLPWTWKYGKLAATAIRVSGSPFKTLAEAGEACRSMVGLLPRTGRVAGNEAHVNFDAPAVLRKWPYSCYSRMAGT